MEFYHDYGNALALSRAMSDFLSRITNVGNHGGAPWGDFGDTEIHIDGAFSDGESRFEIQAITTTQVGGIGTERNLRCEYDTDTGIFLGSSLRTETVEESIEGDFHG